MVGASGFGKVNIENIIMKITVKLTKPLSINRLILLFVVRYFPINPAPKKIKAGPKNCK